MCTNRTKVLQVGFFKNCYSSSEHSAQSELLGSVNVVHRVCRQQHEITTPQYTTGLIFTGIFPR